MKLTERYGEDWMKFSKLLSKATMKAGDDNNEEAFKICQDFSERLEKYKGDMTLTDKQLQMIENIAEGKKKPRGAVKREDMRFRAASMALQGFIMHHGEVRPSNIKSAVKAADALMEELK